MHNSKQLTVGIELHLLVLHLTVIKHTVSSARTLETPHSWSVVLGVENGHWRGTGKSLYLNDRNNLVMINLSHR